MDELVTSREEALARAARGSRRTRRPASPGTPRLQDPRWHAVDAEARRRPAGVPGEPAQAAQGRADARRATSWPRPSSTQVDVDTALRIETRYFVELVTGQVAKNMTKAFFFDMQAIGSGASRPAGYERWTPTGWPYWAPG